MVLQQNGCEAIAYADDIVLPISGRFVNIIRDRMQLALRSICVRASDRGLGINPVKTLVKSTREVTDFSSTEIEKDGTET